MPTNDTITEASTELTELQCGIDRCDQEYYRDGSSVVPDGSYDAMKRRLKALNPTDERLTRIGLPYPAEEMGNKIDHGIPMGSLDNTDGGIEGFGSWYTKMVDANGGVEPEIVGSLKLDGSSIALYYVDGKLERAVTRGNGEAGEDCTPNAVNWRGVPTVLHDSGLGLESANITVRGEVMMFKADFKQYVDDCGPSSNPRNVAAGAVGRHDGRHSEKLTFVAFNVHTGDDDELSELHKLSLLRRLGFTVVDNRYFEHNGGSPAPGVDGSGLSVPDQFRDWFDKIEAARDTLPFEIDGLVAVVCDSELQKKLITDDRSKLRPKFARAVKFPTMKEITTVIDCIISIGHNGVLAPTAVLDPVNIGGAVVSHALLNNWNASAEAPSAHHIAVGDTVLVERSGDVIPKIDSIVHEDPNRQIIVEPTSCPFCNSPTTRVLRGKVGAATYCSKPGECPGALRKKIDHWIGSSKKGVGILQIGDGILDAMIEAELVTDPADLYTLTVDSLKNLPLGNGVIGTSRATTIINNIDGKRSLPLKTFLGSLGISLLGRRRVEILQRSANGKLDTLDQWRDQVNLANVDAEGMTGQFSTLRVAIMDGMKTMDTLIQKILDNGCAVEAPAAVVAGATTGALAGISICFTGTRDLIDEAEAAGAIIKSGVSKELDVLVQKDPTQITGKARKAEKYGVIIIGVDTLKLVLDGQATLPAKPV